MTQSHTLAALLSKHENGFDWPQVVQWGHQMLDALEPLHDHVPPILFGDLTPTNIVVDATGHVHLAGYRVNPRGSSGFAPMEQLCPVGIEPDARLDLFALGATLFCLLTGYHPPSVALRVEHGAPLHVTSLNPQIPPGLGAVVDRLMALDPGDRYPSVAAARQALLQAVPGSARTRRLGSAEAADTNQLKSPPRHETRRLAAPTSFPACHEPVREVQGYCTDLVFRKTLLRVTSYRQGRLELTAARPLSFPLKAWFPVPGQDAVCVSLTLLAKRAERDAVVYEVSAVSVPQPVERLLQSTLGPSDTDALATTFQVMSRDLPGFKAMAKDISLAGMRLAVAGPMSVGAILHLVVDLDHHDFPTLEVVAEVASCRRDTRGYEIGIRYGLLDDTTRGLIQAYCEWLLASRAAVS